jgi:signal transduction histidine kinase
LTDPSRAPSPGSDGEAEFIGGETRLVRGEREIELLAYAFLERAAKSSYLAALADSRVPADTAAAITYTRDIFAKNPGLDFKLIVDLQKENVRYYKAVMEIGVQVRHVEGNKVSFMLSRDEYMATPLSASEGPTARVAGFPREVIWSTRKDLVSQSEQIFRMMWQSAVPGMTRVRQLEEGVEPEVTLVLEDMDMVYKLGKRMNEECREEALMVLESEKTITRNESLFRELAERQKEMGFRIRILLPDVNQAVMDILPQAMWRRLERPVDVSITIYDRSRMFITQYTDAKAPTSAQAVSSNIYSTSKPTIAGMVSIFDALWSEAELREREAKSRRQAQLLQDILTHDIRNYVQISKSNAEILRESLKDEVLPMLDSIERAADSTRDLIERTKKLARIVSQKAELHGIDLRSSIDRSVRLIVEANRPKNIVMTYTPQDLSFVEVPRVLADELLDEAFTNILSNSVQYTPGSHIPIEVVVEPVPADKAREEGFVGSGDDEVASFPYPSSSAVTSAAAGHGGGGAADTRFWRVKIIDHGKGMHDDEKKKAFVRYQKSSGGSGLGLSIVHALVVTRYAGFVRIDDRVPGDYTRGMSVQVLLPEAN